MSEEEHLGERRHLKASKIRPTGASRTSATQAGKPFVHYALSPISCIQRAGSLLVTTLSSWTRTCTPGETWTWSWKVVDLGQPASWRRKRKVEAARRRKLEKDEAWAQEVNSFKVAARNAELKKLAREEEKERAERAAMEEAKVAEKKRHWKRRRSGGQWS